MAALPLIETKPLPTSGQTGFSWTVCLSRRRPDLAAKIGIVAVAVFVVGLCFFHSLWLAGLPAMALLFSLSEFLFPIRYMLTEQAASARCGLSFLEIRWEDVRHAYLAEDGIKLSPLRTTNSRFESLRGVFLRFDAQNADEIMAAVRRLRQEQVPHG